MLNLIKKIGLVPCFCLLVYLIDPFNLGFAFGYLLLIYFLLSGNILKNILDFDVLILLIFSLVYTLFYSFDPIKGAQFLFIYALFPFLFYITGKFLVLKLTDNRELFYVLFFLGFLYSLTGLISVSYDIMANGFVQLQRNVPKIWGGDPLSATNMASYLFPNMCIPAFLLFSYKKEKLGFNLFLIVVYLLSIACVLRLGSRTQLGISLITLVIAIIYKMSKQSAAKNVIFGLIAFVIINIGFSYISIDKDSDVMSAYASRMDSKKYGAATAGGRTERWEKSIVNLVEEPLGWELTEFGFSHNLWLDAARIGGTLAFVLLIVFSVKGARKLFKALRTISFELKYKNVLLVLYAGFLLQFSVEPILDGSFPLFVFFCLFQGFLNGSLEIKNTEHLDNKMG